MEVKKFKSTIIEFVDAWAKKRKSESTEQATLNHLVEEIGEIAREYVNQHSRKEKFSARELENGIGDAFMQLVKLANLRGLDVEDVVIKIIKEEQKLL